MDDLPRPTVHTVHRLIPALYALCEREGYESKPAKEGFEERLAHPPALTR